MLEIKFEFSYGGFHFQEYYLKINKIPISLKGQDFVIIKLYVNNSFIFYGTDK